ncbi:MAG: hypothetical protein ACI4J6_07600 [Oscillospiraceae bacterium]
MSKSIKQYKSAMDNVRISDSFAKRTETLLKEEAERENKIAISSSGKRFGKKYIAAGTLTALAACIAAVFILKPLAVTEDTTLTAGNEAAVTETSAENDEEQVYYEPEDDDFAAAVNGAELLDDNYSEDEAADLDGGANEAAEESKDFENDSADAAPAVQAAVTPPVTAVQETSSSSAQTEKKEPAEGAASNDDDIVEEKPVSDEADTGSGDIKHLYGIDLENSDLDIIFYDITAGNEENTLRTEDSAAVKQDIIFSIGDIIYNSGKETSSSIKYGTEFILRITDKSTGDESVTIYVTDNNAVIVTAHTSAGQTESTYLLSSAEHSAIERMLYLYFGTESDYEAFCALKSGK